MKTEILGIHINEQAASLLNARKNSNLVQVLTAEAAVEQFQRIDFDVVVAPEAYLNKQEEAMLKKLLSLKNHDSMWITYDPGHEATLATAISGFFEELETAPRHSFSVTDNGLTPPLDIEILK
ncbi:hypothetical protein LL912_14785 [Niabella sp. CC-SYL272]|uniref:hypothetical protein n=1 Tax=Niabella agricola TaxID=2891571 RepID=UPI001F1D6330|nr:hypothetical protein [Niabella agricola]MCF3110045.1 hypothetical protein [Niabella agricola]